MSHMTQIPFGNITQSSSRLPSTSCQLSSLAPHAPHRRGHPHAPQPLAPTCTALHPHAPHRRWHPQAPQPLAPTCTALPLAPHAPHRRNPQVGWIQSAAFNPTKYMQKSVMNMRQRAVYLRKKALWTCTKEPCISSSGSDPRWCDFLRKTYAKECYEYAVQRLACPQKSPMNIYTRALYIV